MYFYELIYLLLNNYTFGEFRNWIKFQFFQELYLQICIFKVNLTRIYYAYDKNSIKWSSLKNICI